MFDYWIKKLGQKNGKTRLWLETMRITSAGLHPGLRFNVTAQSGGIVLQPSDSGTHLVSRKQRGEKTYPIVDICSCEVLSAIAGFNTVRVVIKADGVWILPLASEIAQKERYERLRDKIAASTRLVSASLAHGVGVLSSAASQGFSDAGLSTSLAFANEIDPGYLEQSAEKNNYSMDTALICAPLQELTQDRYAMNHLGKVDLLTMGLPCSGASIAGKTKGSLKFMEQHPEVGHLMVSALAIIQTVQPAVVVLENVVPYSNTASAQLMRLQMRDMGYSIQEVTLNARDFGCLENRIRWFMVAVTHGLECDLALLTMLKTYPKQTLGALLDNVPLDSPTWSAMRYLVDKTVRDKADGKGFAMQLVHANSDCVPTIRKQYNKGGSTDPYVQHPSDPQLLRKFTPGEHARIKGIDPCLIEGLSTTSAHEVLGQSIAYEPVRALFEAIGRGIAMTKKAWTDVDPCRAIDQRIVSAIG